MSTSPIVGVISCVSGSPRTRSPVSKTNSDTAFPNDAEPDTKVPLDPTIRAATPADADAVAAIYAPIVETTHISFELEPPTTEEMEHRISNVTRLLPWLIAEHDDDVIGYAYAAPHAPRPAYRWAVDTSIYLDNAARGQGVGTTLYQTLLDALRRLGYVSAFAGIALPNEASVALHRRAGFVDIGSFPVAGFKLGRWIDVSLWRCPLLPRSEDPAPPQPWR
jgi:phosphinothricin acetyltransferase